jgi:hypothetical protein
MTAASKDLDSKAGLPNWWLHGGAFSSNTNDFEEEPPAARKRERERFLPFSLLSTPTEAASTKFQDNSA